MATKDQLIVQDASTHCVVLLVQGLITPQQ